MITEEISIIKLMDLDFLNYSSGIKTNVKNINLNTKHYIKKDDTMIPKI